MATAAHDIDKARQRAVYVFEAPVRIWHWLHALSIVVLAATGYLIANPLPSIGGEASDSFLMGNLRLVHFVAGYVFAIGLVVRIYWGLVGNRYSRELLYLPVWRREWWGALFDEMKYYAFLRREAPHVVAHNALAQAAMWFCNIVLGIFMIITGFALYSEGLGQGSWADKLFGWAIPLLGGSQSVRMWHVLGMWLFITFAIIHIYMAIRADVMSRQSSISAIISGWRLYRD